MFPPKLLEKASTTLRLLREHKLNLYLAESCTGGLVSAVLTEVEGSSTVMVGGTLAYANSVKTKELAVGQDLLLSHGAVSQPVVETMARSASQRADLGLAVSGVAGPGGGTAEKPVGRVYISLAQAGKNPIESRTYTFSGNRSAIRLAATEAALDLLQSHVQSGDI